MAFGFCAQVEVELMFGEVVREFTVSPVQVSPFRLFMDCLMFSAVCAIKSTYH